MRPAELPPTFVLRVHDDGMGCQDLALMILEDPARAFAGEIARGKPGKGRRPLDELPHGGRYSEFHPLCLALAPGSSRRSHDAHM